MRRPPLLPITIAASSLGLALAAIGRQRALEPLSPPDLAFFHQSIWSAAQGAGFAQTALPFEGQTLFGGVHLSLVNALMVPVYALAPGLLTLVAVQALTLGIGGLATASLARSSGASPGLAAGAAFAFALHPLTVGLATCDFRPIVFLGPGALLLFAGAARGSMPALVLGGLLAISAREEALWVLLAASPGALWLASPADRRRVALGLALLVGLAAALPLGAWGRLSNLDSNPDHAATIEAIRSGARGLFRSPEEVRFGIWALLAALPALRAPLLLAPAVAAWAWLAIMSGLELAVPQEPGVHYLAVAWPFLVAAGAVGLGRTKRAGPGLALAIAIVALLSQTRDLPRLAGWMRAAVLLPTGARHLREIAGPVEDDPGGLVAEPRLAPWLAGRALVHVRGNLHADPAAIAGVVPQLSWALLEADTGAAEGRPALERSRWRAALQARGCAREEVRGGIERWACGESVR